MDEIIVSIPTKVTLFGEHAVVYGKPAIATTIPVFIEISGVLIREPVLTINMRNPIHMYIESISIDRTTNKLNVSTDRKHVEQLIRYMVTALEICEDDLKTDKRYGYVININSDLPPGIGLGTSAAISVGTITLCELLNNGMTIDSIEKSKERIAYLAWKTEQRVQGMASPMDTFTITFGGLRYIDPTTLQAKPIDINKEINILVGATERKYTTAELVRRVRMLKEKNPLLIDSIMSGIGYVVSEAYKALIDGDWDYLGMLMNINHGFLEALGIVDEKHSNIIHILRKMGALGAKTSGAGGGGAFIALARSYEDLNTIELVAKALGAHVVAKKIHRDGVTARVSKGVV
ncbi:mevalonate kinase [Ignisphaera aggregans DSM 17230]|uniref:Mevalonate kinase n=1 Tax=Ignisphaera aggregans (strain DSM 17230 / JCM 13409 / AQ1.S1) TaxID=583356 RepID=E0SQL0_IGNAA|nr:mevalonate kinase [Ignisphaera aggregans DSM 17230]